MAQVGRELMAAARTRSPAAMATVIERYGDVHYIGLYSLGSYRNQLSADERSTYFAGMVRFIGRYAANEAPKYPVARVEWADQSFRGASGLMVDSKVVLEDGSVYEVRWLLSQAGRHLQGARCHGGGLLDDAVPQAAVRGLHRPERRQPARPGRRLEPVRTPVIPEAEPQARLSGTS